MDKKEYKEAKLEEIEVVFDDVMADSTDPVQTGDNVAPDNFDN